MFIKLVLIVIKCEYEGDILKKKAQAAMEFLLTYGWAILVITAIIGVILAFVDFSGFVPERCEVSSDFRCEGTSLVSSDGETQLTLLFYNGLGYEIEIVNVSVDGAEFDCTGISEALVIPNSETGSLIVTCDDTIKKGDVLDGDLIIDYKITLTGSSHRIVGNLRTHSS
ncbi:hypothetical protein DRJ17_02900 [Candidatus Woesearchaeota archaeon]|nr:MAG: hypothetical protein DRJ17_02900 [Candidatus Woesearchaeota archaeon]